MRLSPVMFTYLRELVRGPVPLEKWKQWDQRRVRALFFGGYLSLSKSLAAEITNKGVDAIHAPMLYRRDAAAPTFKFKLRGRGKGKHFTA